MKMNNINILSLMLIMCTAIVSCIQDEIGDYMHDNDGEYQMNAIINTINDEASISICKVQKYTTVPVTDANIAVLVNGELCQFLSKDNDPTSSGQYTFDTKPYLKIGDKVEFVANIGSKILRAESQCLQPLIIEHVDTIPFIGLYNGVDYGFYRVRIKLRKPEGMKSKGNFFRLDINHYIAGLYNSWVEKNKYTYNNDIALNNGNVDNGDNDIIQIVDKTANRFGVFSDDYFNDGTYTLVIEMLRGEYREEEIQCIVSTITSDEYNYLRSVCSILEDIEISGGSPVLNTNITGGRGLVAIESAASYSIKWFRTLYKPIVTD